MKKTIQYTIMTEIGKYLYPALVDIVYDYIPDWEYSNGVFIVNKDIIISDNNFFKKFKGLLLIEGPGSITLIGDMNGLFCNSDITNIKCHIDTSQVTNMDYMFTCCKYFNGEVKYDTSLVESMFGVFQNALSFNKPINWDFHRCDNISYILNGAKSYNQEISWDTRYVTDMHSSIRDMPIFNKNVEINTQSVEHLSYLFYNCKKFNKNIHLYLPKVRLLACILHECPNYNGTITVDIGDSDYNQWLLNIENLYGDVSYRRSLFKLVSFNGNKLKIKK